MSTTNEMYIEFFSDNSMSKKGFAAEYHTGITIAIHPFHFFSLVVTCFMEVYFVRLEKLYN